MLTDLQSTNGTKVNGENVQLWVLRPGDVIAVGRTLLLFGSQEEIAERLAALRGVDLSEGVTLGVDEFEEEPSAASLDFELNFSEDPDAEMLLHTLAPPELPGALSPGQAAQLAEMLQYVNLRMRGLIQSVKSKPKSDRVTLEQRAVAEPARPRRPAGRLSAPDRRAGRVTAKCVGETVNFASLREKTNLRPRAIQNCFALLPFDLLGVFVLTVYRN